MRKLNNNIYFTFRYDKRGYGYLEMHNNISGEPMIIQRWYARSGSCDIFGVLVNAINPGTWYMIGPPQIPVLSEYDKMRIEGLPGIAWKQRLWPIPCPPDHELISHYLIHPDGNKPGTAGCIGIQNSNAKELYSFFLSYFNKPGSEILRLEISNYNQPKKDEWEVSELMIKKETLKTKSFWLGMATLGWGIFQMVTGEGGIEEIIAGMALIFGRDAISKVQ